MFAVVLLSCMPSLAGDVVRASGNSVFRWQIGDAEASLFEGDCVVQYRGEQVSASSVLLVSDGPPGKVRTRAVISGIVGQPSGAKPTVVTFMTEDDPFVQSPRYRGAPQSTPHLLSYLGDLKPKRIAQVPTTRAPVARNPKGMSDIVSRAPQLLLPPANAIPANAEHNRSAGGVTPGGGVVPAQFSNDVQLQPPASGQTDFPQTRQVLQPPIVGQPNAPLSTAPSQGLVVDSLPPPPTTFSDGSTTGGLFFTIGGGSRSVEIKSRNSSKLAQFSAIQRPVSGGSDTIETVIAARGGVTILVRDVTAQYQDNVLKLGTVSLSADRIVAWTPPFGDILRNPDGISQSDGEFYLEGDIVVRQGKRIIYAERMYYNATQQKGVVLDAETITTIPEYQGIVRLKADVLQQIAPGDFVAYDAALTSSRLGVPRYWMQSEQMRLFERVQTGRRATGEGAQRKPWVTSNNNFVYFGGVPLLYWPRFSTSLEYPTFYISGAKFNNDNAFGNQVLLDWDVFQIFGVENPPDGVDWEISTDYLSDRGPALGTNIEYRLPGFLGVPGQVVGDFDAWIIDDRGDDRLGLDRLNVTPEKRTRGRSLLRHRQYLPNDYELIAELGWISDRNFLEQYLENEWDQNKDHETAIRLRRYFGNNLFDLSANVQVNDFFTETEHLPSFDHYLLGGSFGRLFTWSAHNRVAYARINAADAPDDPAEAAEQSPLPGDSTHAGVIASTRQELTMPLGVGPIKFVPYVSGEASHYGEASDGNSLTRLFGQAGIRASLPMSKSDPTIQSSLLNVRGLAHKMEWTAEYLYADSDTDLDELPLYDPLDDNAQEQFRRRFIQDTYGGVLPAQFDPRTYALRHGLQRWVASPSDVIADDLEQLRLGLHQRWQTKRGLPGRERIVDLMQFDMDWLFFPDADRDNFGETVGPAIYDFRYHLGDRFSILSDGYFDFFDDGLRSISAGLRASKPGLGDWYIGLLSLEGPISSTVLRTSLDYRLNEKWIFSGGTAYDFGNTGNIGQTLGFTRIGESLLVRMQVNVDSGRDNVSVGFSVEPRFWPSQRLGRIGGKLIPPPGVEGLE